MAQYLITGCSGAGKSSLLEELGERGNSVVREPGRRAIANGFVPWENYQGFLHETERLAQSNLRATAAGPEPVFFDRGLLDAVLAMERLGLCKAEERLGTVRPYATTVFFASPWPELFQQDANRRHDFAAAVEEAEHLRRRLPELGYELLELPQVPVSERADFILSATPSCPPSAP